MSASSRRLCDLVGAANKSKIFTWKRLKELACAEDYSVYDLAFALISRYFSFIPPAGKWSLPIEVIGHARNRSNHKDHKVNLRCKPPPSSH